MHVFPAALLHVSWLRINDFVIHHEAAHEVIYFGEVRVTTANTNIAHSSASRWSLVWSNCGLQPDSNTCRYLAQLIIVWETMKYFYGSIVFWRLETFWCIRNVYGIVYFWSSEVSKAGLRNQFQVAVFYTAYSVLRFSVACPVLCAMQVSPSILQCTKCSTVIHYEFILLMERVTQSGSLIRLVHCWVSGDV